MKSVRSISFVVIVYLEVYGLFGSMFLPFYHGMIVVFVAMVYLTNYLVEVVTGAN